MKTLTSVLISSLLLVGVGACTKVAKTSEQAPESTTATTEAPGINEAQDIHQDGTSDVRRDQLNADIRAREQRTQMAGDEANRADADLKSEVRSKLEANLPDSQLSVDAKDGNITVSGTVPTEPQLQRIEPLAKEINGVKTVVVNAVVSEAQPQN